MWTHHTDSGNSVYGGQTAKNIYLGDTRIVTKLNSGEEPTYNEEYYKQYYYHSDHLGSASLITDYKGDEYQRIEYTPYGETWVEKTSNTGLEYLPYRFTGKEIDEETGLYYYGARYLDSRYSRWISTDPALGEYIPGAGKATASEAGSLPGIGGIFNTVNLQLYHYAGNNPVKYTDPDGNFIVNTKRDYTREFMQDYNLTWPNSNESISSTGCSLIASNRAVNAAIADFGYSFDTPEPSSVTSMLDNNSVTSSEGMIFGGLKNYLANFGVNAEIIDSGRSDIDIKELLKNATDSKENYLVIGRLSNEEHFININGYDSATQIIEGFDTSRFSDGTEKRNLKSLDVSSVERLILIRIKDSEE